MTSIPSLIDVTAGSTDVLMRLCQFRLAALRGQLQHAYIECAEGWGRTTGIQQFCTFTGPILGAHVTLDDLPTPTFTPEAACEAAERGDLSVDATIVCIDDWDLMEHDQVNMLCDTFQHCVMVGVGRYYRTSKKVALHS